MNAHASVVLKLSGEALGKSRPLDGLVIEDVCRQIVDIAASGVRVGIVVGGGNIIRGSEPRGGHGLPREILDLWGMRATVLNAWVLHDQLAATSSLSSVVIAKPSRVSTGLLPWHRDVIMDPAVDVVIVGGGLGRSGMSTDVAAPELARDMDSSLIVMSKHGVDHIYTGDPNHAGSGRSRPRIIRELTATEALEGGLRVMDHEAIRRCRDYGITVRVVGAAVTNSLCRSVLTGEALGSVMHPNPGSLQRTCPLQAATA